MFSTTSTSGSSVLSSIELNSFIDQVKDKSIQIERNVEVVDAMNMSTVDKSIDRKPTTFEALAAETELDMLLNSFGETNLPKTTGVSHKPVYNVSISHWGDSAASKANLSNQPSTEGPSSSTSALMNGDIDDTLDDLLRDTSITTKHNNALQQQGIFAPPHVPAPSSKPTGELDDFDSWLDTI